MFSHCRIHDVNQRKAQGIFRFRIICGAILFLIGINWLLRMAGITVMEPVASAIFPLILVLFGTLLIMRAFSRRRGHGQA